MLGPVKYEYRLYEKKLAWNVSITTAIFFINDFFFHKVVFRILTSDFVTKGNFKTDTI